MKLALVQHRGYDMDASRDAIRILPERVEEACRAGAQMVLLPECAYPAYFVGLDAEQTAIEYAGEFLETLSGIARRYGTYIVAGVARRVEGLLYNSAVVIDAAGVVLGSADKSNLWHFDYRWFQAGAPGFLFDSPFGRIGVMVCADGRIPEIARILRLRGAQLILDAVNLVASAEQPENLSNQQYRFILQTRAMENGIPIAVCDKVGVEGHAVTFLGRSFVTLANGEMVTQATSTEEIILYYEIPVTPAAPIALRKPHLYGLLALPTEELPITRIIREKYQMDALELPVSVARFAASDAASYLQEAKDAARACQLMDAKLVTLPPIPQGIGQDDLTRALCGILPEGVAAVCAMGPKGARRAIIITCLGILDTLEETHGAEDTPIRTVELFPDVRISALFGEEMMVPEIARVTMLQGADLLLWFDDERRPESAKFLSTRAAENKIFTLRSTSAPDDASCITDPTGATLCTTFRKGTHYAMGIVDTVRSKSKNVIPGTNIVYGRQPENYEELTRPCREI